MPLGRTLGASECLSASFLFLGILESVAYEDDSDDSEDQDGLSLSCSV